MNSHNFEFYTISGLKEIFKPNTLFQMIMIYKNESIEIGLNILETNNFQEFLNYYQF